VREAGKGTTTRTAGRKPPPRPVGGGEKEEVRKRTSFQLQGEAVFRLRVAGNWDVKAGDPVKRGGDKPMGCTMSRSKKPWEGGNERWGNQTSSASIKKIRGKREGRAPLNSGSSNGPQTGRRVISDFKNSGEKRKGRFVRMSTSQDVKDWGSGREKTVLPNRDRQRLIGHDVHNTGGTREKEIKNECHKRNKVFLEKKSKVSPGIQDFPRRTSGLG